MCPNLPSTNFSVKFSQSRKLALGSIRPESLRDSLNMSEITITPCRSIRGELTVPGDKSISHRAIMISSLSTGKTEIEGLCFGEDLLRTIEAFRQMGVVIEWETKRVVLVRGKGLKGLKPPEEPFYLGNSGTTMRLLLGILAGQEFESELSGDDSLNQRPMKRVTEPLRLMGAHIQGRDDANFAPLTIRGGNLKGIDYPSKIASAQVKSAILLAGLYAQGTTRLTEPEKSRDHTERMLKLFAVPLKTYGHRVTITLPKKDLFSPGKIVVPGDISSAAFFLVAAAIAEGSQLTVKSVGLNPTRTGIIDILKRMGADIEISNIKYQKSKIYEPVGDITVKGAKLLATTIKVREIPRAIDELPILMVAASCARGKTCIRGAGELRVKETDRINSMVTNLNKMGAKIKVDSEGNIIIEGTERLRGSRVDSFADHRTAMSMVIAGLVAEDKTTVTDTACINTSFPDFIPRLQKIIWSKNI